MLSKSLTQFSVEGLGCVPSLLFDLRPNYGEGNEDNGDFLQKVPCTHCYTPCPQSCSRPPPTHASAGDSGTLTGKSGWGQSPVGSLLLAPGSWRTQGSVCGLQDSVSQSSVSSGGSMVGSLKKPEFQENIYFCFIDYAKAFDCVDHSKLWKILKEKGIPDHLTCLLRNLYAGQEETVRTGHGTTDWFRIGKGVRQGCILSLCLFNLYAEDIMRNARPDEA